MTSHTQPTSQDWAVRLAPLDPGHGIYTLLLHDPETWTQSGPYHLQFPTTDAARAWLEDLATLDHDTTADLDQGRHIQGTASPTLWRGIISALSHCAGHQGYVATQWWYGAVPPWQETSPYAPPADESTPAPAPQPQTPEQATPVEPAATAPPVEAAAINRLIGRPDPDEAEGWTRLIEFVAALIALTDDVVVVSVDTDQYRDGDAYVQLCREDDGGLTLEAVSSQFLDPPLPPDAINALHELGWQDPPGDGLPNYIRTLDAGDTAPGDVAAFLVQTLRVVYSATPTDLYQFAPHELVEQLLRGDFGPRFKLDPNMPEARKARRHLGLRFPIDLAQ